MSDAAGRFAVAIVGGGLSGLAAAYRLAQSMPSRRFVVLEGSDRFGGRIRSGRQDGFLLEAGPDSLVTNKPAGLELCRELGLEAELVAPAASRTTTQVYFRGRVHGLPAGLQLVTPTRLPPLLRSGLFSQRGKLQLLAERFKRASPPEADELLRSFIVRRFGEEAYERVVEPILGGLFVADAATLSLALTAPRLAELERRFGSVTRGTFAGRRRSREQSPPPPQLGLRSGMQSLVDRLQRELDPTSLWTGARVAELASGAPESRYRLALSDGRAVEADSVILACPGGVCNELLVSLDEMAAQQASQLEYASCATVHLAYPRDSMRRPPQGFGFFACRGENLPILACSYPSEKFPDRAPEGHVLCRAFVGGALRPHVLEREDQELIDTTHATLVRLHGLIAAPTLSEVRRHRQAMPQFTLDYAEAMRRLAERIDGLPGLELAGSTVGAYGLPDCIASGYAAAERIDQIVQGLGSENGGEAAGSVALLSSGSGGGASPSGGGGGG